ncbi:MAG: methyltransferase domain-containing protein [Cellulosilyticaceae bacterium]
MGKQYSIKEVARLLGINANKIRFYEKKGLINPERGEANDYRYFSDEEVIKLHSILLYRVLGLSVKDIEGLLKNTTKENYLGHFYNQWKVVNDKIHELSQMRGALENIMDEMYRVTDGQYTEGVLTEIQHNVEKLTVKNNWKDKWAFDNWARSYDRDVKADRGTLKIYENYEVLLDSVVKEAIKSTADGAQILDIGVGTGNLSNRLYNLGYDITGVDQSRAMLEVAKSKNSGLKVRLGEFMKLPFENKSFDAIVSTYAFHHLDEKEKEVAVEEMIRVLADDGVIVIGDLMFESDEAKNGVYATLTAKEIDSIEDEYYTNIRKLEEYVGKHARKMNKIQIDRLCWIVTIG